MVEISNLDAIIELILREARARKGPSLTTRVYNVVREVDRSIGDIMETLSHEERRKKEDENKG